LSSDRKTNCRYTIEAISFDSEEEGPKSEWGYEDIDRKVRELGIIPPLVSGSYFEKIGRPLQPINEFDVAAEEIAEALILQKQGSKKRLRTGS
jgi:hypothetical protein